MATETTKHTAQTEAESRHSALEELYRDERRPALLLLSGLVIAVIFFALGIMVGRWTITGNSPRQSAQPAPKPAAASTPLSSTQAPTPNSTNSAPTSSSSATENTAQDGAPRYSLLIATFNTPEEAQPLVKRLEEAGYKEVRLSMPRANQSPQKLSVLVGHYTRDEAEQLATRMRSTGDTRLRNVRVIEAASN